MLFNSKAMKDLLAYGSRISSILFDRNNQSILDCPTRRQTTVESVPVNTIILRPFFERFGYIVVSNSARSAGISRLFLARCPTAITRFVIAVIVNAVNGQSWRRLSHILKEVLKAVKPSIANLNAAPAVMRIPFGFWV